MLISLPNDGFRLDKSHLTLGDLLSIVWSLKSVEQATGFGDISKLILKINKFIDPPTAERRVVQIKLNNPF